VVIRVGRAARRASAAPSSGPQTTAADPAQVWMKTSESSPTLKAIAADKRDVHNVQREDDTEPIEHGDRPSCVRRRSAFGLAMDYDGF